jgi:hypothetical protein
MRLEALLVLSVTCVVAVFAVFAVDFTVKNYEVMLALYCDHRDQVQLYSSNGSL